MTTLRGAASAETRSGVTRTDGAQRMNTEPGPDRLTSGSDICNTSPLYEHHHHK